TNTSSPSFFIAASAIAQTSSSCPQAPPPLSLSWLCPPCPPPPLIFLAKNLVRGTIRLARAAICLINPQAISRSFSVFFSFSLFVLFF
ncbi:unnamed protein product, partial [Brassica oleracea var. botrytis]